MNLFVDEVVTAPSHLPITVDATKESIAKAVVEELERGVLWRAIVSQTRRSFIDGRLPDRIDLEPVSSVSSITRWTPTDPAVVVPASTYSVVTRDPSGTTISLSPGSAWPDPSRTTGSFTVNYQAGWEVTDTDNAVPASVLLMIERAVSFRAGSGGVGDIKIGSLDLSVPDAYATDAIPREIASIGRSWAYRPGIFAARP